MSQGDDDESPDPPGDEARKRRFSLELTLERAKSQLDAQESARSKPLDPARKTVEAAGETKAPKLPTIHKPTPFVEVVQRLHTVVAYGFDDIARLIQIQTPLGCLQPDRILLALLFGIPVL